MIFFAKEKSTLQKLREHEYADAEQKEELLEQLASQFPAPRDLIWMLTDNDSAIRNFAAEYIKKDKSQAMLHLLIDEVKARPQLGKKYILPIISGNNFKGFFLYVNKNISSPDGKERILVMEMLSHGLKVEPFFSIYQEAVGDPEEEVRYLAVHKLCSYIESDRYFLLLSPLTADESERIRQRILLRMAKMREDSRVVEPFFARLPYEKDSVQEKMIASLSRLAQNPELHIEERLIPELASENVMAREVAARLLAQMSNKKQIIRKFLVYTRGIAFWLRERIFESIGTIAASIADMMLELLQDEDQMIRLDSMFLAVYIRDHRIIPGVVDIVQSDMDWWVKSAAIDILAELNAAELPPLLKQNYHDPDLQSSIISAFQKIRHPSGLDFLIKGLDSKSRYIRLESFRALLTYDLPQVKNIIKKLAETSADGALRYEATKIAEQRGIAIEPYYSELDRQQEMLELQRMGLVMADAQMNEDIVALSVVPEEYIVEQGEVIAEQRLSAQTPIPARPSPKTRENDLLPKPLPVPKRPDPAKLSEVPKPPFPGRPSLITPNYPAPKARESDLPPKSLPAPKRLDSAKLSEVPKSPFPGGPLITPQYLVSQNEMDSEATAPFPPGHPQVEKAHPTVSQREKLKQLYRQIQEGTLPLRQSDGQELPESEHCQNQTLPDDEAPEARPSKRILRFKLSQSKTEEDDGE